MMDQIAPASSTDDDMRLRGGLTAVPAVSEGPPPDELDFGAILRYLWLGKWWILAAALIFGGAARFYANEMATPIYTASTKVVLENRRDTTVDLEAVMSDMRADAATINTEIQIMMSPTILEGVVRELALYDTAEFNPRLREPGPYSIGRLRATLFPGSVIDPATLPERTLEERIETAGRILSRKVSVAQVPVTFVFQISARTESRQMSMDIVNTLASLYIQNQLEVKFEATRNATEWLTERVAVLQEELEAAEDAVKTFNSNTTLIGPEVLEALNRQLKELRDRRDATVASIESVATQLDALRAARAAGDLATVAAILEDRTLTRLMAEMASAEDGQATELRALFEARVDTLEARLASELTRAEAQIGSLETSVADLTAQIDAQSNDLVELRQLQREAEASRLIHEYFLGRLKEISVQEGIQEADSRVLSVAARPLGPSAPRKGLIQMLATVFGIFLGAAFVLFREFRLSNFRTADALEGVTRYPVMGEIPQIPGSKRASVIEYLREKPTSAAAEAVRNLRTSTLLSNLDVPPKVIMSTSSIPGEGKTTQSLSLASNLAGLGKRVLVIEGDIRRRVFSQYFKVTPEHTILDVMSGNATLEGAVVRPEGYEADVLMASKTKQSATDVFSSESFRRLIAEARAAYDYVVIDTPPVLVVPDARVIGQVADAILYSVKWNSTSRLQVQRGLKSFESVGLRVTGLVLSQISAKGMQRYGYGEAYGAYSRYGSKYYDN
ncbi:MAG: polysaccharide biosynthesis tyrosine autokinase [Pseudomonadota bacterium]